MIADTFLTRAANLIDIVYFGVGILAFWAGTRIWRGKTVQTATGSALTTIEILKANIEAVDKQRQVEKEAADKVIVRLEKQLDDLTVRNQKLEDQVKTLSIIPWERQQQNYVDVMQALGKISDNQEKLSEFFTKYLDRDGSTVIRGPANVTVQSK